MTQLQEILQERPDFDRPKLIVHANCRGPFMAMPEIACAVVSSTTRLIGEACAMLLERIDRGAAEPEMRKIPCRCVRSDDAEFRALSARHFQLN